MQSYQVFVNDHLILLTESSKESDALLDREDASFHSFVAVHNVEDIEIKVIVDWLLKEKESTFLVNMTYPNLAELWKVFQTCFQLIEAAGGLVVNKKEELLMIYRLKKWDLPKGKIEKGETPQEAAIREVEEECGIDELELQKELVSTYHVYPHKDSLVLKRTYWFEMRYSKNEILVPQTEEEIEKAEWVSKEEIQRYKKDSYTSLKSLLSSYDSPR